MASQIRDWQLALADAGVPADVLDATRLLQGDQQLHQPEGDAAGGLGQHAHRGVRRRTGQIGDDLEDSRDAQRRERDAHSAGDCHALQCGDQFLRCLVGAQCNDPRDRQLGQPGGQRLDRGDGAAVRPLQVVDDDHQPVRRRASLQPALQLLDEPVAEVTRGGIQTRHLGRVE